MRLEEIRNTLKRELSLLKIFVLEAKAQTYFEPKAPHFGEVFGVKFQTAGVFEVDEAAKCIALSRPTAAVFHLMRVMEIGIRAVARCLGIPDPIKPAERNWGHILKAVKDELDAIAVKRRNHGRRPAMAISLMLYTPRSTPFGSRGETPQCMSKTNTRMTKRSTSLSR